jgi:hypothetical protein
VVIDSLEVIDNENATVNGKYEIKGGIIGFNDKDIDWFKRNLLIFEDGIAAGVHIASIGEYEDICMHFQNEYVYMIQFNHVGAPDCNLTPKRLVELEKDKGTLVKIFNEVDISDGFFELFSSWANEEVEPRHKSKTMTISDLEKLNYVTLRDREYIKVVI